MRGIGYLIGIDTDKAGPDTGVMAVERLGLPKRPLPAEGLAQKRRGETDEGAAAADLHFHQQRLAFVQAHAA